MNVKQTLKQVVDEIREELHRHARTEARRTEMAHKGELDQFLEGRRQKYEHLVDFDAVKKRIMAENMLVPADL